MEDLCMGSSFILLHLSLPRLSGNIEQSLLMLADHLFHFILLPLQFFLLPRLLSHCRLCTVNENLRTGDGQSATVIE
jgi:hypothetical protein